MIVIMMVSVVMIVFAEDLLKSIADQIEGRTICAHGEATAWPVQSFILKFRDEFVDYARRQAARNKKEQPLAASA